MENNLYLTGAQFPSGSKANYITVYFITREYGGPEEGGWYYDNHSKRMSFYVGDMTRDKANALLKALYEWEDFMLEGNRPLSSVLSTGEYRIMMEEDEGEFETKGSPRYE
jgi:hypothetical protein